MKINIIPIIQDHLLTLHKADVKTISTTDINIFFTLPLGLSIAIFALNPCIKSDTYNVSITFFGIFIALLLNIQVAIFSIFQRKWHEPEDEKSKIIQMEKLCHRKHLIGEINSNISYLTLVCFIALIVFLILFTFEIPNRIETGVAGLIYTHFMLTLLMIIKRAHALFQEEYHMDNI